MLGSVLAFFACNNAQKAAEAANRENEIRQRTIDSIAAADRETVQRSRAASQPASSENTPANDNTSTEQEKRKGMSNTTKGALIGTGVGIATGAATGAAVSKDKGKGAVIGGAVGGAVGSGVGYGVGAKKDRDQKKKDQ